MIQARGTLVRWMEDKGFGFIRPDDGGKDVFVHIRDFGKISRAPKVGDTIRYQPAPDGAGKFRAAAVLIEGLTRLPTERVRRARANLLEQETSVPVRDSIILAIFISVVASLAVLGKVPVVVPLIYVTVSCCTILVYEFDKSAAMNERWRTKENTLHLLAVMGGGLARSADCAGIISS